MFYGDRGSKRQKCMGDLRDIGQKLKGKAQQLKGELNQQQGQGVKGGFQKLKGKVNEVLADEKLRARANRRRTRSDW